MFDPTQFDSTVLPNGITVYSKPWPMARSVTFELVVPRGHRNNCGEVLPGSYHFLEHLMCRRSRAIPEVYGYLNRVLRLGGDAGAGTSNYFTRYYLHVAGGDGEAAIARAIAHLTSTIIRVEDVRAEASIITSEIGEESIHYPGTNRYELYRDTRWRKMDALPLEQVLGSPDVFRKMSAKYFQSLRKSYFATPMAVFVAGDFRLEPILKQLSRIKTVSRTPIISVPTPGWTMREYHEAACLEHMQYIYHYGGHIPPGDVVRDMTQTFLLEALTNPAQGVLYNWLRLERSCIYSLHYQYDKLRLPQQNTWDLIIPVPNYADVEVIRRGMPGRIARALDNSALLQAEHDRQRKQLELLHETPYDAVQSASQMWQDYRRVYTHDEVVGMYATAAYPGVLQDHYERYWNHRLTGEFLATPLQQ